LLFPYSCSILLVHMNKLKVTIIIFLLATLPLSGHAKDILTYKDIDEMLESGNIEEAEKTAVDILAANKNDYIAMTELAKIHI